MEIRCVNYEELQRDKRADREEDARRLRLGLVTPEQLENEYSLVPLGTTITIRDLCQAVERHYGE